MSKRATKKGIPPKDKSLESWIWDAACSIRGAKDAPKYKDYILPLIFTKRLCDVFDDELDRFPAGAGFPGKSSADWGWVQHMHASLGDHGRAAVVFDTGAASGGSGNAGTNKEKTVRQWFVNHDLIESVLSLPENLFYNNTAPGIVVFLNKAKPKKRQDSVLLVNASQIFEKGDPQNFIPKAGIQRIADTLIGWQEEEKLSRIVDLAERRKNGYNISPSRYIHTSDAETYRPIGEIVAYLDVEEKQLAKRRLEAGDIILERSGGGPKQPVGRSAPEPTGNSNRHHRRPTAERLRPPLPAVAEVSRFPLPNRKRDEAGEPVDQRHEEAEGRSTRSGRAGRNRHLIDYDDPAKHVYEVT